MRSSHGLRPPLRSATFGKWKVNCRSSSINGFEALESWENAAKNRSLLYPFGFTLHFPKVCIPNPLLNVVKIPIETLTRPVAASKANYSKRNPHSGQCARCARRFFILNMWARRTRSMMASFFRQKKEAIRAVGYNSGHSGRPNVRGISI